MGRKDAAALYEPESVQLQQSFPQFSILEWFQVRLQGSRSKFWLGGADLRIQSLSNPGALTPSPPASISTYSKFRRPIFPPIKTAVFLFMLLPFPKPYLVSFFKFCANFISGGFVCFLVRKISSPINPTVDLKCRCVLKECACVWIQRRRRRRRRCFQAQCQQWLQSNRWNITAFWCLRIKR